jgi:3-phosphoshikimate 1-carboxyvinyltransferase
VPLPDLIEIVPLDKPVHAEITVPGSKSITNRALVLAALADGPVTLQGALWSEDTQIMVEAMQQLGFKIEVKDDPDEFCNRTITVHGLRGKIPNGGTVEQPLELFVGNAGTAARFLAAMVCLGQGVYRLHGVPRMHERPQAALFAALRELGYRVEAENGNERLPARISGGSPSPRPLPEGEGGPVGAGPGEGGSKRRCKVSIEESSQFASALLLCAKVGGWEVEVVGENAEESPYVEMTKQLCKVFPANGGTFQSEPDASSGSYFLAADWLLYVTGTNAEMGRIRVNNWPATAWQIDASFSKYLELPAFLSRKIHLGDSIMTAIIKAPFRRAPIQAVADLTATDVVTSHKPIEPSFFTDLARLRVQECERVVALRTELTKCGAEVVEKDDTLTVYPSKLHGAEIETYNDHRMAMCFAVLGLKVPGIKIKNPACVKKTFPNFFQKLAAAPPHGLGVRILDGYSGRAIPLVNLFADQNPL